MLNFFKDRWRKEWRFGTLQVEWCKAPSLMWKSLGDSAATPVSQGKFENPFHRAWLVWIDYLNYFYMAFNPCCRLMEMIYPSNTVLLEIEIW